MTVLHQAEAFFGLRNGALGDINLVKENFFLCIVTTTSDLNQGILIPQYPITKLKVLMLQLLHQLRHMVLIEINHILAANLRRLYHIQFLLISRPSQ